MKNQIKYISFLLILILFTFAAKADAQTTETDTLYYYDRDSDNFLILSCSRSCRPISVGFNLLEGYSYSIEEIRISIKEEGKYAFSIHLGTDFPDESNIIYQDSVLVLHSERDSIWNDELIFKSILLGDIAELKDLKEKFWFVLNAVVTQMNNIPTPPDSFSQHSFAKVNFTDTTWYSFPLEWVVEAIVSKKIDVGVETESRAELVSGYNLIRSYPNPFNSITTITYEILHSGFVKLMLYDVRGREIIHLYDGYTDSGKHELTWNGLNTEGKEVPSGIYIATLSLNNELIKSMKLMLIK